MSNTERDRDQSPASSYKTAVSKLSSEHQQGVDSRGSSLDLSRSRFSWTTDAAASVGGASSIYSRSEGSSNELGNFKLEFDDRDEPVHPAPVTPRVGHQQHEDDDEDEGEDAMPTPRPPASRRTSSPPLNGFKPSAAPFPTVVVSPGVKTRPRHPKRVQVSFEMYLDTPSAPLHELDNYTWKPLPLAHALGMPLMYLTSSFRPSKMPENNYFLQILSIKPEFTTALLKWTNQGIEPSLPEPIEGAAMLIRTDGRAVREKHLEILAVYIDETLREILDCYEDGQKSQRKMHDAILAVRTKQMLSPEAFAVFWMQVCTSHSIMGDRSWEKVERPVNL